MTPDYREGAIGILHSNPKYFIPIIFHFYSAIDTKQVPDMARFEAYERMSMEQKDRAMWATIEHIADGKPLQELGQNDTEQGGNVCE